MFGVLDENEIPASKTDGRWLQLGLVETVVNASADYICAIDRDGRVVIFNAKYEQLTGIPKADALGKNITEIFPHITSNGVYDSFQKALGGESVHNSKFYSAFTDKYYESHFIPLKSEDGVYGVLLIAHDINDRLKAEESLLRANEKIVKTEELYHRMINEVEDYAIIRLSAEGIIENWNKGAEKIKGYKANEAVGQHFSMFYTKKDRDDKLPAKLLNVARTQGRSTHDGWRVRKDGSVFWGSITITALHNDRGEITGFSKVTRDLTGQKIAQDQLKVSAERLALKNKELERSNNELTSFSYVASHDLQEPLRKIKTFGKLILDRDGNNLSESGRDYFGRMINAADRMKGLMDALLEFSRVNTEKRELELADLNLLAEDVKKELSELLETKNATVNFAQLPKMEVIPFQFKQVLHNLISNSIKYSREGVAPVINVSGETVKPDSIADERALRSTEYYCIKLRDNGIGFETTESEKIFELFQRLHGKSEYSGSGIGLSICKKIAENHGGFITAEGKPGEGATFYFYIPIKDNKAL